MKVEALKGFSYLDERLNEQSIQAGAVFDMSPRFVPSALQNREVKPFRGKLEVKSNNQAKRRTSKPSRTKGKPTDHSNG